MSPWIPNHNVPDVPYLNTHINAVKNENTLMCSLGVP